MKKLAEEAFKFFWIPVIMAVVSYIFFTLKDVTLGIIVLVALSAAYTLIRLYATYKKWWLLIILVVVLGASVGAYFFKAPTISLTVNDVNIESAETNIGGSTILVSPAPSNGLYSKGTVVTLTAKSGNGQDWKSWVGTDNDNTNPTTIKMDNTKQIRVIFDSRYQLIVNNQAVIGSLLHFAEGDISITPAPDNDGKFTAGTKVNLSVRPNTGYDWKSWTGTDNDGINPTSVIMTGGNKNVNVDFEGRFTLYISDHLVIGATMVLSEGSVKVTPGPGDDGKYAYGTKITLVAQPDTGYGWKTWSGTLDDANNPTSVNINSDKHVAVSFEERYLVMINNKVLKTSRMDLTGGQLTADPAPADDTRFTRNTIAMFTVVPAAGYRFDKWTGDVSDTVTSVSLVLDSNKSISVTFIRIYNLTTSKNIAAAGTVSPDKGVYDTGSEVTITATPASGYRFDKWTGDISGNTPSVKITMANDMNAIANFIKTYLLTINVTPDGGGTVTPASGTYDEGSVLLITAAPASGYAFVGWEGLSDNSTSQNVTMSRDLNLLAKFDIAP